MRKEIVSFAVLSLALLAAASAGPCDGLAPGPRAVVDQVFASEHPYDGCAATFAACLAAPKVHPLGRRLADSTRREFLHLAGE